VHDDFRWAGTFLFISIFVVQLVVLSMVSIAPAGIIFWITFMVMRETTKNPGDNRAGFFFSVATEITFPA
jgi:hypothetical protein